MQTRIFHHGKTDGFILLRSLIFSAALITALSAVLLVTASIIKQSNTIKNRAEQLIRERNSQTYQELSEQ